MDFELIDVQIPTTLMENFEPTWMQLAEFLDILQDAFAQITQNTL